MQYRDEPEFETGQILVNKQRSWAALGLTMWMNEYSDFWYRHIHGDKETFHMAWRKLNQLYAMPSRGIESLPGTMCQHDFEGRRIFQHRNTRKWSLAGNGEVPGFHFELECFQYIETLRPHIRMFMGFPASESCLIPLIAGRKADYHRVGHDHRILSFDEDGRIGIGAERMERFWVISKDGQLPVLEIFGDDGLTARCMRDPQDGNVWRGAWRIHERMPIVFTFSSEEE